MMNTTFLDVQNDDDKAGLLGNCIDDVAHGLGNIRIHINNTTNFAVIPESPFAYWVGPNVLTTWKHLPELQETDFAVEHGMATKNDFRFLRLWVETFPQEIGKGKKWEHYAKGGEYSQYYSDVHLIVLWEGDGKTLHEALCAKYPYLKGNSDWVLHPECSYHQPALTYSRRTQKGFSTRALPANCRFDKNGPTIVGPLNELPVALAISNSVPFNALLELTVAFGSYEIGLVSKIPWPISKEVAIPPKVREDLTNWAMELSQSKQALDSWENELGHVYRYPGVFINDFGNLTEAIEHWNQKKIETKSKQKELDLRIDDAVFELYGIRNDDKENLKHSIDRDISIQMVSRDDAIEQTLSYFVGSIMGRWDIRFAAKIIGVPELPDVFDSLPVCPPGMLTNDEGRPATQSPDKYPIEVDWDGILVDDPGHPDDIINRIRDALHLLWGDRAYDIEQEMLEILGEKSLRYYFSKSGNTGFFMQHVKRYSKSRRKAPIYWYLQSNSKNYGLWLYYHRLDSDLLYKALTNYVRPKVQQVQHRMEDLRARTSEDKSVQAEFEEMEDFYLELVDFRDKLQRAADLNLQPDLNDGVVLNIAPLHELVPWKYAERYWKRLLKGEYEWSSISQQLRERGLVKQK